MWRNLNRRCPKCDKIVRFCQRKLHSEATPDTTIKWHFDCFPEDIKSIEEEMEEKCRSS